MGVRGRHTSPVRDEACFTNALERMEPRRRSTRADEHNPVTGRPGSCCRPLHVASGMGRGRAAGNDPPTPWLPEGRCEPEPSPAAQTKQCRLMPKPSGTSPGIPHRTWLVPRTRASSGGWLWVGWRDAADLGDIEVVLPMFKSLAVINTSLFAARRCRQGTLF